jgi:ABC-2 type transport system permease protein
MLNGVKKISFTNKQLYKISKHVYREAFLTSQLEMAGGNSEKLIEKMGKSKNYMRTQSFAMKFFILLYIFALISIPISVFQNLNDALASDVSVQWLFLSSSLMFGLYFVINFTYLVMFGMFFASGLMSGEPFQWLSTLPLSKEELQKISLFSFLRGIDAQLIGLAVVLPIGTAIITKSVLLTLIAVGISILNIFFSIGVLVLLGGYLNRVMNANDGNSKKNNLIRVGTMVIYIALIMSVSFGLSFIFQFMATAILSQPFSNNYVIILAYIVGLFPIFLSAGGLIASIYIGTQEMIGFIIVSIIGCGIFILLTKKIFSTALKSLNDVVFPTNIEKNTESLIIIKKEDITIQTTKPIEAYFLKDKQMATRDMQMFMLLLMPLILPLIITISMISALDTAEEAIEIFSVVISMNLLYLIIGCCMLVFGLLSLELSGSTILSTLPIVIREQAIAKLKWSFYILPLAILISIPFYLKFDNSYEIILLNIVLIPIGPAVSMILIEMKAFLFGKLRNKYILEELNREYRILKWILICVIATVIYVLLLLSIFLIFSKYGILIFAVIFIPIEIAIYLGATYIFNRFFPKPKKDIFSHEQPLPN